MKIQKRGNAATLSCTLGMAIMLGIAPLPGEAQDVKLELFADGFTSPIELTPYPDESGGFLISDQVGTVHLVSAEGEKAEEPFLDLRESLAIRESFDERGLLGLALHPDFAENRKLYVYYSAPLRDGGPEGYDHTSHISEFTVEEGNSGRVDRDSERIILQVDQPQFNHNGGNILFGPDGFLYISLGDGGAGNDVGLGHPPEGNGQDTTTLLGSILRIDVDSQGEGENGYGIPSDNPFVDDEDGRDEIFAYGLRNTWGMSFDNDGNLFGADVGQNLFEIVNIIQNGNNYGWRIREGFHCFDPENPNDPPETCPDEGARGEPLVAPVIEYENRRGSDGEDAHGISVTGGHVYSGEAIPDFQGKYIFGDWSRNWGQAAGALLIATPPNGDIMERWSVAPLSVADHPDGVIDAYLVAVGQDADGEIYFMTNGNNSPVGETGKVYKLVPAN